MSTRPHKEFRDGITARFAAILAAIPKGDSTDEEKSRIGFPVSNPIYDRLLDEPPARGDTPYAGGLPE